MKNTTYGRYYDLTNIDETKITDSKSLLQLIYERTEKGGNWVVYNGSVIENCQIFTTHNLLTIF